MPRIFGVGQLVAEGLAAFATADQEVLELLELPDVGLDLAVGPARVLADVAPIEAHGGRGDALGLGSLLDQLADEAQELLGGPGELVAARTQDIGHEVVGLLHVLDRGLDVADLAAVDDRGPALALVLVEQGHGLDRSLNQELVFLIEQEAAKRLK